MIRTRLSQRSLALMAILPAVAIPVALFFAVPWLKSIPDSVAFAILIPIGLATLAWGLFIAALGSRNEDEVQRASGRFATTYGFVGGSVLTALLLMVPQFSDFVTTTANAIATAIDGDTKKAPLIAFVGGVVTLSLATAFCSMALGVYWWKSRR